MRTICLSWLAVGAAVALLAGCQSGVISDGDKLTRDEYISLVNTCRVVLLNPKLNLTEEQKTFLREQAPTFAIDYTGYKQGKFTMSWRLPGKVIASISGDGKVLERSCRIRVAVSNF